MKGDAENFHRMGAVFSHKFSIGDRIQLHGGIVAGEGDRLPIRTDGDPADPASEGLFHIPRGLWFLGGIFPGDQPAPGIRRHQGVTYERHALGPALMSRQRFQQLGLVG